MGMPYADEPPAEMSDADIAAEVGRLQAITNAAEVPEEDLTEGGHARLYALQDEQERRNYSGPWEVASGCSEGGAAPDTDPGYRAAMIDAGRGHLLRD